MINFVWQTQVSADTIWFTQDVERENFWHGKDELNPHGIIVFPWKIMSLC